MYVRRNGPIAEHVSTFTLGERVQTVISAADKLVLVDPGTQDRWPSFVERLQRAGLTGQRVSLLTACGKEEGEVVRAGVPDVGFLTVPPWQERAIQALGWEASRLVVPQRVELDGGVTINAIEVGDSGDTWWWVVPDRVLIVGRVAGLLGANGQVLPSGARVVSALRKSLELGPAAVVLPFSGCLQGDSATRFLKEAAEGYDLIKAEVSRALSAGEAAAEVVELVARQLLPREVRDEEHRLCLQQFWNRLRAELR